MRLPKSAGVVVVGSINADLVAFAGPLPRPGETTIGSDFAMVLGGKGANQAVAAARIGAEAILVGVVGDDPFADLTLGALTEAGVDSTEVQVVPGPTGIAHVRVDAATGQNDIVVVPLANAALTGELAELALRRLGDRVGVVLLQLETPVEAAVRAAHVGRELGALTVLDPGPARPIPDHAWRDVDVVTPNQVEAADYTGVEVVDLDSARRAGRWFTDRGVGCAILTMAEDGVIVVSDDEAEHYAAPVVPAIDSTGAGDAFVGCLGAGLAAGLDWPSAVRRAVAAGSFSVGIPGASPSMPTRDQLEEFLSAWAGCSR